MKRLIGLDFGEKTLGVSVSDELGWTAQGVETIRRKNENSLKETLNRLAVIVSEYNSDSFVLGFPKNMNNTEGPRCQKTLVFKEKLEKHFPEMTVYLFDERLSTSGVERILLQADISRGKRKDVIDKMAAVFILQGYLDLLNNQKNQNLIKNKEVYRLSQYNDFENENFDEDDEDLLETIIMTADDGSEVEFCIIDELQDNGETYLLLVESEYVEDEESEAVIFQEVKQIDEEVVYQEVDGDNFDRIAKLFSLRDDDYEIEL